MDFLVAPSPIAELRTTSFRSVFKPSQCRDIPLCARRFQIGCMSELPIVSPGETSSTFTFTGLKGSMGPKPQEGRTSVQEYFSFCLSSAFFVAGIRAYL